MKEKLKKLSRNKWSWIAIGVLLAAACAWLWINRDKPSDHYDYIKVERGNIRVLLQETGNLAAFHRLNVIPPLQGRVESIEVNEGADVKKGAILAWISSTERAAVIDAARAKGGSEEEKFWMDVYKPAPLLAPLDGHIIAVSVVPGQVLAATQTVFVMSDFIILQAYVDETDLHRITDKQAVEFYLSGISEKDKLTGKVFQIAYDSSTVNNVTTYMIKVAIDNPPDYLRSGLTADVYFVLDDVKDVLKVPSEFISVDNTVLVATSDDSNPELRKVEIGATDGNYTQIKSGLVEGDWVARAKFNLQGAPRKNFSFGPKFDNTKKGQSPPRR
jgi:macrolide-specific efflux system membrane fusion protein